MVRKITFILSALLLMAVGASAQVTTSALSGLVTDENDHPMIGASVQALHVPSGTSYNAVSNLDGRFTIQGMRTGGPYTVQVSFVGYAPQTFEGIRLQLGNTYSLGVHMERTSHSLSDVVVTAPGTQQAGASHNFSTTTIESTPTVERNIYDVVKNMPLANRSKIGGISFAGSNNRYNSFQIDGTVSNDVYGLASTGTNGGQASANPISMDAIQEIQVVVAPFDVRQSGFTGGGINVITKQGSNDYHATFYTYYNNQNFYGRFDAANDYAHSKLSKQHFTTVGGNVSGPIVKDKLFFFLNIENHNESYPGSYYPGYSGNALSVETAKSIADRYYALTGVQESYDQRDVKRNAFDLLARLDWNISDRHKLALRYQHGNAYDDKWSAGMTSYVFNNSSYRFNNVTNSFVAELNSDLTNNIFNEFRASYNRVRDNRDVPYLAPVLWIRNVPNADADRSNIGVNIGTDYSSAANYLNQDIYLIEDNLSFYRGRHTITFGTHNEIFKMRNLFIQYATGEWIYNSYDAFLADQPTQFVFRCTDPSLTDGNLLYAPTFRAGQFGLYLQDKFNVTSRLELTLGLRMDLPVMFSDPTANVAFNSYAYEKNLGVRVGEMPSPRPMWSPRFGFRWYADEAKRTLLRGGIGLFTGRVPFVWLGNAFNNNGVEIIGTTINGAANIPAVTPNTAELVDYLTQGSAFSPDIATVSKKFRYPQVLRANLAWEQMLPGDIKFTLEGLYSKTYNQAFFRNLALTRVGSMFAVPGVAASEAPFYAVDNKFYSIINLENTNKGYSYNISATVEKNFDFGLDAMVSYTYGRSKSVNDCTSSVAYSNWKYNYAVDSNNPELSYSSFDQPHRLLVNLNYTSPKYANGLLQTTVGLTYNGYSGQRYSLTMSESADYNGDGYRGNSLLYIPTADELTAMQFSDLTAKDADGNTYVRMSADEQRAAFNEFIEGDSYAKNHRGEYAKRNCCVAPFESQIDLHLAESIFALKERGSKVLLTFDVLNFANMLNKKWGTSYSGIYTATPLNFTGSQKTAEGVYTAKYTWNGYTEPSKANIASRWHAQIGVKLIF